MTGVEPGTLPFSEWPEDDPFVILARTYGVTPDDLARVCRGLSREIEARAVRAGYDEVGEPS